MLKGIETIWECILKNNLVEVQQDDSQATYWPGRKPSDGLISSTMGVEEISRLVRATSDPYPGAYFFKDKNTKIIVWEGAVVNSSKDYDIVFRARDGLYAVLKYDVEILVKS